MLRIIIIFTTLLLFNIDTYAAFPVKIIQDANFIVDPETSFSWFGFFVGFLSFLFLPWSLIVLLWFPRSDKSFKRSFWIGAGLSALIILILLILFIFALFGGDWSSLYWG